MKTEAEKREAYYKTPQRLHDYGGSDKAKKLVTSKDKPLAGEVSSQMKEAEPFEFL